MSTFYPPKYRTLGETAWAEHAAAVGAAASTMPTYWTDRVAYRVWLSEEHRQPPDFSDIAPLSVGSAKAHQPLELTLKTHPAVGDVYDPTAFLDAPFSPSPFLTELVGSWVKYLRKLSIDTAQEFDLRNFNSLRQLYAHSAHCPAPPAIDGPGFLDMIAESQQLELVAEFGRRSIADFAIGLQVIHEGSHFLQTGDPLLEEFALAALWVDFVDTHGYRPFLVDKATNRWCTIEEPFLATAALSEHDRAELFVDTWEWFSSRFTEASHAYESACRLTYLLDTRTIRYSSYLEQVSKLLAARDRTGRWRG